jgi:hypothetical protein
MTLSLLSAGMMAFATAAAVPFILHLVRRGRAAPVKFPAMMFLRESALPLTRGRRPAEWLLLAARAFLALAFAALLARPVLRGPGVSDREKADVAVVFVMDDSFSMAAGPEGRSPLDRARAAALDILQGLADGAPAGVALTSGRRLDPTADRVRARAFIEDVRFTCRPGRPAAAVTEARRMLASETRAREIFVLSDFGASTWADRGAFGPPPADGILVHSVDLSSADGTGAAVTRIVPLAPRVYKGVETPIEVFVRRANAPAGPLTAEKKAARVTLTAGGRTLGAADVLLTPGETAAVRFTAVFPEAGAVAGEARLTAEDGREDARPFAVDVHAPARALLVAPAAAAARTEGATLASIFHFAGPGAPAFFLADAAVPEELPERRLAEYDVLVVTHASSLSAEGWRKLAAFVDSGRGALVFMDSAPGRAAQEAFSAFPVTADAPRADETFLSLPAAADARHPAAAFRGGLNGGLDMVAFRRVTPLRRLDGSATALINFDDGAPAVIEVARGPGRAIFCAFGPGRAASDLPASPAAYFVLVNELAARAAGIEPSSAEARGGETVRVRARPGETSLTSHPAAGGAAQSIRLDPVSRTGEFTAPDARGVALVEAWRAEDAAPGVAGGGHRSPVRVHAVTVTPPEGESAEDPLPPGERKLWARVLGCPAGVERGEDGLRQALIDARPGVDAGWVVFPLAAALFALEMLLASVVEWRSLRPADAVLKETSR